MQKSNKIKIISSFIACLAIFLFSSSALASSHTFLLQPADAYKISNIGVHIEEYNSYMDTNVAWHYQDTAHLTSIHIDGVTFFNGTLVNNSGEGIPITIGDDLRVDGAIFRDKIGTAEDNRPVLFADAVAPAQNNAYYLGSSSNRWSEVWTYNLQGDRVVHENNLAVNNSPNVNYALVSNGNNGLVWVDIASHDSLSHLSCTGGESIVWNGNDWVCGSGASTNYWARSGTNLSPMTAGDDILLNVGEDLTVSDMSQGSMLFAGAGGLVSQDNVNLFWDDTNNRLGIGINTPDEGLHIASNMRLNGAFEDGTGNSGTAGQVLSSTGAGTDWADASALVDTIYTADGQISGGDRTVDINGNYLNFENTNLLVEIGEDEWIQQMASGSNFSELNQDGGGIHYNVTNTSTNQTSEFYVRPDYAEFMTSPNQSDYTRLRTENTQVSVESDVAGFNGAVYGADYSANYVDRSLVDKAYVDSQTLAATNGLTVSSGSIGLGGDLVGDTYINHQGYRLIVREMAGEPETEFNGDNFKIINTTNNREVRFGIAGANNAGLSLNGTNNHDLFYRDDYFLASSDSASFSGIQYAADYSANFVDRSLVDKAYVDSHVGTSIWDADMDTGISVEATPDDDTIRFDTAGTERMKIESDGRIGAHTDTSLVSLFTVGSGAHEPSALSVSGDPAYMNIANFRDEDGESIFRSRGSIAGSDFEVTFGDYEGAGNETFIGVFDGSNHYEVGHGEFRFLEDGGPTGNYVGFIAPSTLSGSQIWTLPDSDGTVDQVLTTDGAGTLSWATGSGSPAGNDGAIQYNNGGSFGGDDGNFFWDDTNNRLGIGTNSPGTLLEVAGSVTVADYLYHQGDSNTYTYFTPDRWQLYTGGRSMIDAQSSANEVAVNEGGTQTDLRVEGGSDANLLFTDGSTDNVGIGTNTPDYKLQVNGTLAPETTDQDLGTASLKWDAYLNNVEADEMTVNDLFNAPSSSAAPSSPQGGTIYYDTDDHTLYVYDAGTSSWDALN